MYMIYRYSVMTDANDDKYNYVGMVPDVMGASTNEMEHSHVSKNQTGGVKKSIGRGKSKSKKKTKGVKKSMSKKQSGGAKKSKSKGKKVGKKTTAKKIVKKKIKKATK